MTDGFQIGVIQHQKRKKSARRRSTNDGLSEFAEESDNGTCTPPPQNIGTPVFGTYTVDHATTQSEPALPQCEPVPPPPSVRKQVKTAQNKSSVVPPMIDGAFSQIQPPVAPTMTQAPKIGLVIDVFRMLRRGYTENVCLLCYIRKCFDCTAQCN